MLTAVRLKQLLLYELETGNWTWIATASNRNPAGNDAGAVNDQGYRLIRIDGRSYRRAAEEDLHGAFAR
jgi:hypothetical protein